MRPPFRGGDRDIRHHGPRTNYNNQLQYNDYGGPGLHGNQMERGQHAPRRHNNRRGNDDFGVVNQSDRERRGPGGYNNNY